MRILAPSLLFPALALLEPTPAGAGGSWTPIPLEAK